MSDEDDYLSDKFLFNAASSSSSYTSKTYSQLRQDAEKKSKQKNEQNRFKSRRARELESRQEGLSKSLFERAEEETDGKSVSKALAIMMKMGFAPGQSLGKVEHDAGDDSKSESTPTSKAADQLDDAPEPETSSNLDPGSSRTTRYSHRTEPLPLSEWAGRKGIGVTKKRAGSPSTSAERVAKMAKLAEEAAKEDFRDRSRREFEERRAESRLGPAQRTCVTLDEKAGKTFNVLWLNPRNADSFPPGLVKALSLHTNFDMFSSRSGHQDDRETNLRIQMQSDALQPTSSHDDEEAVVSLLDDSDFSQNTLEEVTQFLRLQTQDQLQLVLSYLRSHYAYCFWCGTQYDDEDDMANQCPGPDEEAHD